MSEVVRNYQAEKNCHSYKKKCVFTILCNVLWGGVSFLMDSNAI